MGRLAQGHFDDVFLNKIKEVCIHVLDQLNDANEIEQAFDLCPSISRRNRVILNFLRDADQVGSTSDSPAQSGMPSTSASPHLAGLRDSSIRASREPSLGTDSVASLSAQRRRRAREMQYVRDPNDSNDDSDSQATVGPSTSRNRLGPQSARNPAMTQPDYTFEQFADHLDPTDKLLKRSFEIIIKETARQALAKKRDPNYDPTTAPSRSSLDPTASLRSAIASSRYDRTSTLTPSRRLPRPLSMEFRSRPHASDTARAPGVSSRALEQARLAAELGYPEGSRVERVWRFTSGMTPAQAAEGLTSTTTTRHSGSLLPNRGPDPLSSRRGASGSLLNETVGGPTQRRPVPRASATMGVSPSHISARLAEASRRNAEAARTIDNAERFRSSQFIRTSIESLRASLFQLHIDLACTQLQQGHADRTAHQHEGSATATPDIGSSYALVMDTIELFDDTLPRLSCLVSNANGSSGIDTAAAASQPPTTLRNADASQMRTSLWRARNLLLLSSMTRRANQADDATATTEAPASASRDAELRAHRHLLATMEETHWSRPDASPPTSDSIRAWRRKLAAWYHLDRDARQYPDAPASNAEREESYARWHPDLELPYALDDEILAPMPPDATSARPNPISDARGAWAYARRHDTAPEGDLGRDEEIKAALEAPPVVAALQSLMRIRSANEVATAPLAEAAGSEMEMTETADAVEEVDPDVSLTRTTSLSRRGAVRGMPLNNSDSSSIRSARSSLSLRRARETAPRSITIQDDDAVEEDVVETSIEIGSMPPSPMRPTSGGDMLLPPPTATERPRAGRSGSFTFISTPADVLRSRARSQSRSSHPTEEVVEEDDEEEDSIDRDLDLELVGDGEEGEDEDGIDSDGFDFALVDFLRSEARRRRRERITEGGGGGSDDDDDDDDGFGGMSGVMVTVSGSGASTPAEARQATFEAYAQRARLLERRTRLERRGQPNDEDQDDAQSTGGDGGGGNGSQEASPESSRRRRGRNIGHSVNEGEEASRNTLPFPRTTER